MTDVIVGSSHAAELRDRLADELVAKGTIVSKEVEAAFRAVPRHLFAPGATTSPSPNPYSNALIRDPSLVRSAGAENRHRLC